MKRIVTVAIVICMCFCFLSACLPNSTQLNEDDLGVNELSNKEKVTESTQSESGFLTEDSGEVFIDESQEFYSFIDEDNNGRINDTYSNYLKTERGRNKTEIDLLSFMETFSVDSLTDMEDGYLLSAEVGGVLVFDQRVVMNEDDLLRYHISKRPYLSVSDIGIYESYDQMKQMDFHKQYKIHCLKYTKENTPIYVIDEDVTHMYYFVYFSVNGNWFRVTSPGYRYPSSECILRNSDEWTEFSFPERYKKQFEAIRELTDISNQHSILVEALKNTEKGATQASDNSVSNAHEQGDTDLDSESPIVESSVESANSTNQETTSRTTNMSEFESSEKQQMDKNGILFIDGKEIEYVCVFNKETREAELPLLTIVKELGAKVEWLNSTNVCISYDGNEIELDTEEDGFGIYPPPGTIGAVRKVEQNEIIMDSTSINALIVYWFHHKVDVDFDKNVVNVVEHHVS